MSARQKRNRAAVVMVLNLIGIDKCCKRKCSGNERFQMPTWTCWMNFKRSKSWNDSCLQQKIQWIFPWTLSSKNSWKFSVACPTSFWAMSLVWTWLWGSIHRKHRIVPVLVWMCVRACVCVLLYERERERERERTESAQIHWIYKEYL